MSKTELVKIEAQTKERIEEAVRYAEESPFPAPEDCLKDVYVSYPNKEVRL